MSKEKMREIQDAVNDRRIIFPENAKTGIEDIPHFLTPDMRSAFESGAAWQREHQYTPHAMNAVRAHEEAMERWKD
jgi:hypothetical protein